MPYQLLLPPLLLAGPFFLALGLTLPLVRFEKLYFFEETPSLIGIVTTLWRDGSIMLAFLVALFSVLFPIAKILVVFFEAAARGNGSARPGVLSGFIPLLSKWSMMDVLLVALVIVAAKTSGVADAFTQPGLWFYAGSALSVTVAHWMLQAHNNAPPRGG
ncbi:paraquat-inducible protein A [Hoeflea sp.]|uniref:paraquat-inducible protein A n=1 Tax=Hoeflea sp. TaxID=1940281 RepID=UPI003B012E29